jgi:hypothetical protein
MKLEPSEAIYCAKFFFLYHQLKKAPFNNLLENIYIVNLSLTILNTSKCKKNKIISLIRLFLTFCRPCNAAPKGKP